MARFLPIGKRLKQHYYRYLYQYDLSQLEYDNQAIRLISKEDYAIAMLDGLEKETFINEGFTSIQVS